MFPKLQTNRLSLEEITMNHKEEIFRIFSNVEAMKYYGISPITKKEEAIHLIGSFQSNFIMESGIRFAMIIKDSREFIGTIGLQQFSTQHRRCEVGYELHPLYWGLGYATESLQRVIEFAFTKTVANRIGAIVYEANPKSERVVEKLDFQFEGLMKEYYYQNGIYYDVNVFSLLKKDWLLSIK